MHRSARGRGAGAIVAVQCDAGRRELAEHPGQERVGDVGVDEQRLGGVADAGTLKLRVEDDRPRRLEVGAAVDVDVAVARRGVDDGHGRDALERRLQSLAAARDDQIDRARLGRELGELRAAAAGDRASTHPSGSPAADRRLRRRPRRAPRWSGPPSSSRAARTALPDFRHSAAASIVTFGRAS